MLQHEYIAVAPLTYSLIMCSHLSHTNASIIFCSCQCFTTCEAFEAEYCRGKKLFRNKIKNKRTKKTHWWLKINILAIKFMNNV